MADTRIHGTTKQYSLKSKLFDTVERAALQPLPRASVFLFSGRTTPPVSMATSEVARAYYSGATGDRSDRCGCVGTVVVGVIFNEQLQLNSTHSSSKPGHSVPRSSTVERRSAGVEREWTGSWGRVRSLARITALGGSDAPGAWCRGEPGVARVAGVGGAASRWRIWKRPEVATSRVGLSVGEFWWTLLSQRQAACAEPTGFLKQHALICDSSAYEQFVYINIGTGRGLTMNDALRSLLKQLRLSICWRAWKCVCRRLRVSEFATPSFWRWCSSDELAVRANYLAVTAARQGGAIPRSENLSTASIGRSTHRSSGSRFTTWQSGRFIRETPRCVLFLGPPGVGKSFLIQAIGATKPSSRASWCCTARSSTWSATSSTTKRWAPRRRCWRGI